MLAALGIIFYIAALFGVVGVIFVVAAGSWSLAFLDVGAIISCLFFGAMCNAADRALALLAKIAGESEPPRPETEGEREERMSRVVRWDS